MAQQEIPEAWRRDVCAVLKSGRTGNEIQWTFDATNRYNSSFNFAFPYEVHLALLQFFQGPPAPKGCPIVMEKPAGKTYEFLFPFKNVTTYGKVLLHSDRKRITIFSAHRPLKSKLSCD
jgi:hypothetical protein